MCGTENHHSKTTGKLANLVTFDTTKWGTKSIQKQI